MTVQARIEAVFAPLGIEVGFSATHLASGQSVAINPGALFPTASVYKIAIMVELYRQVDAGKFALSDRLTLGDGQRVIGSGVLQKLDSGLAPTLRDLAMLMIIISDNTATHMLQELVGSANINATMRGLGLADIHVALSLPESFAHGYGLKLDPLPDYAAMTAAMQDGGMDYGALTFAASDRNTTSSAADMAALSAMILAGTAGSAAGCADMMTILRAQQLRDRVPRYLPTGAVGNKTGTFRGVRNDAGVMLRGEGDAIAFGLFTFDRTALPPGNSRLLAQRNALVNDAMAEVGMILWESLGV
ncbi:MAG: serine hydrolase [Acetobacteraceae bacterium]|nr:serine hydrolase [Acetobacteraceae bacterium]